MPIYIALLRAVNVGGTGRLPMNELTAMCVDAGFSRVTTYIASGNVVLQAETDAPEVKYQMERRLKQYAGKPVAVVVRTLDELCALVDENPFKDTPPNRTVAIFLDSSPPQNALDEATGVNREVLHLGIREIYVYYPDGIADSKLKIPAAKEGTARNFNTIFRVKEIALQLQPR